MANNATTKEEKMSKEPETDEINNLNAAPTPAIAVCIRPRPSAIFPALIISKAAKKELNNGDAFAKAIVKYMNPDATNLIDVAKATAWIIADPKLFFATHSMDCINFCKLLTNTFKIPVSPDSPKATAAVAAVSFMFLNDTIKPSLCLAAISSAVPVSYKLSKAS